MESATAQLDREPDRNREAGPPPAVSSREEAVAFPVSRIETIAIFLIFGALYTFVGFHILADLHVVSFDALDRLTRAFMVWYNDPPKLASIGFSLPPIGTFVMVPFAAIRDFVTSGFAIPLSSAIFGALALTSINRMFAIADMSRIARLVIVALVGLNPMFAFYSMNGTGDAAYLFFAAFGLFCMVGWGRNGSARFLIGAGLAFSLAALTRYEFILWAGVIAFLIAWTLTDRDRDNDEVEGSTIAFLAPIAYALGIWIFFNAIVLGDPFEWVSLAGENTPVNAVSSAVPGFDLLDALGNVLRIELIFPATLIAVPLLLIGFGGTRDTMSIGFALLIVFSILYQLVSAALDDTVSSIELKDALPSMLAGIAGFAWLYLRSDAIRPMIWGGMVLLSVIALITSWSQMQSYPHQNLEQAFTRAISTGDDQEGTGSRGGYQVGIAPEREMARFIEDQEIANNEILTDNSRTYGVIALSGRPDLFFDRVDRGDEEWQAVLENPEGEVEFMLIENGEADLILEQYPDVVDGGENGLEVVVQNDRYTLVRVVDPATSGSGDDEDNGSLEDEAGTSSSSSSSSSDTTTTEEGGSVGSAPPITGAPTDDTDTPGEAPTGAPSSGE
jgi:hypothetical protein